MQWAHVENSVFQYISLSELQVSKVFQPERAYAIIGYTPFSFTAILPQEAIKLTGYLVSALQAPIRLASQE